MSGESKISASHLELKVCIYVRQSTSMQVQEHEESRRRQYELRERAIALGWQEAQMVVIDEDQGKSASEVGQVRAGFEWSQRVGWAITKGLEDPRVAPTRTRRSQSRGIL